MQQIDVNERITGLERLNPTPRPTTSVLNQNLAFFMHLLWDETFILSFSFPGLHFLKVDGTSSGSDLEALDFLLLDSSLSE